MKVSLSRALLDASASSEEPQDWFTRSVNLVKPTAGSAWPDRKSKDHFTRRAQELVEIMQHLCRSETYNVD